jgi:hypothetical protein
MTVPSAGERPAENSWHVSFGKRPKTACKKRTAAVHEVRRGALQLEAMAVVGSMGFFVWKVRSTASRPTQCPSCNAVVARDMKACPSCGNTL